MYLLDTNQCSQIIDGDTTLVRRVAEAAEPVVTCAIVYGELVDMAYRSDRRAENAASVRQFLADIGIYSADDEKKKPSGDILP